MKAKIDEQFNKLYEFKTITTTSPACFCGDQARLVGTVTSTVSNLIPQNMQAMKHILDQVRDAFYMVNLCHSQLIALESYI